MRSSAAALLALSLLAATATADEPVSLLQTVSQWRYPDAKINGAKMADAATVNGAGDRTTPSIMCSTTMTTPDPVAKVLAFYHTLLTPAPEDEPADAEPEDAEPAEADPQEGRSVLFSDESEGRPFAMHTILVNTATTSTTLIVTRGVDEEETRITWKRYVRF
ncbi:hypothetical protein Pla175_01590 [Pirellulimonas nuda]|uniref:Lipocalin-like domain-containing protein n=1 Tax=Pirellulimonas nuda TaxID=2528009 RepID=A0A518D5Q4_9BACT|nr:hypothetical protein [Pirellulimonas nuda]QDU86806.1 hypothetical protein Pla175_01590 [Pirellulimonas nuda]